VLNLDTNIIIRAVDGSLAMDDRDLVDSEPWSISAMVLWEIEDLHRLGRIRFGLDHEVMRQVLAGTRVWPISPAVCLAMRQLDFESDPADELIAATSIAHNVPLVTRDRRILSSRVVPLALR
jgi:PIN domain nuclease of toxin-antitoxin system